MAYIRVQAPSLYSGSGSGINEGTIEYKVEYKGENESTYNDYQFDVYSPQVTKSTGDQTDAIEIAYEGNAERRLSSEGIPKDYTLTVIYNEFNTEDFQNKLSGGFSRVSTYPEAHYNIVIELKNDTTGEIQRRTISNRVTIVERLDFDSQLNPVFTLLGYEHHYNRILFDSYLITVKHTVADGQEFSIYSQLVGSETWGKIQGTSKTSLWNSVILDFNNLPDSIGRSTYDIRISRRYPKASDMYSSDSLILSSITEVIHGNFIYPNTALLGLRIKATGQLSGAPPNINVLVSGRKVSVPRTTGNEDFDDLWYNPSSGYWETNVGDHLQLLLNIQRTLWYV